jgi:hypothetical protein
MFRALLAHPQDALHKPYSVYCVLMSIICAKIAVALQSWHGQLTLYAIYQWRTQEFFSGGFNKFSYGQRADRTGIWGAVAP